MRKIVSFEQFDPADFKNDHVGMWAAHLGMSREEYVAHYASPTIGSGIDEALRPDELEHLAKEIANHVQWDSWEPTDKEVMDEIKKDKVFGKDLMQYATANQKKEAVKIIQDYLAESIDEAVRVSDERYIRSHGKSPRGFGKWMFSYDPKGDNAFVIPTAMNYSDAKKWVSKKAKEDNQAYVFVMEANDHEVGMAQGQLEAIHKAAGELQEKIGTEEKDLPGWIQDHISQAYSFLQQANDNFHELEEAEGVDEKLKMLMDPLMVKIMKQFGFNSDPGIKAELREEIRAAVEEVLKKHDIIVEGSSDSTEE